MRLIKLSETEWKYIKDALIHAGDFIDSWENNEVGGFEITIDNFEELDDITANIYNKIPYNLNAKNIKDISYRHILAQIIVITLFLYIPIL